MEFNIAIIVVSISIVLGGISLGIGRALSYKKLENFGKEEILQSVINAAIIGSAAVITEVVKNISLSLTEKKCATGEAVAELSCQLSTINDAIFLLFQEIVKALNTIGYYQTLNLEFGTFAIQPFINLHSISSILSIQTLLLHATIILINLNIQILYFFSQSLMLLLFPLGLILRTFFATRKVGGLLIALSLGLYLFFPVFVLIFPHPETEIEAASTAVQDFNNNQKYATVPIMDLNDNYAIAEKLDSMREGDFSNDLTILTQKISAALAKILLFIGVAPLFSLLITIIFIQELTTILGSELQFRAGLI